MSHVFEVAHTELSNTHEYELSQRTQAKIALLYLKPKNGPGDIWLELLLKTFLR